MSWRTGVLIVLWIFILPCTYANVMLLWGAIEMPFLTGSGAAQADLGVYQIARHIGLPIALATTALLTLWGWLIARSLGWSVALRRHFAFVALAFFNILIPLAVYVWITRIWRS